MRSLSIINPTRVILFTISGLFILIWLHRGDHLLLGGEMNFYLDFSIPKDFYTDSWNQKIGGTGSSNPVPHYTYFLFHFFSILQEVLSIQSVNLIAIFLFYAMPFLAMLWLTYKVLKHRFSTSYLISLFYIVNPFVTKQLESHMFSNIAPLFVLPIALGFIYKYYNQHLKLFWALGVLVILNAFLFSNIPYAGIYFIFLFFSVVITDIAKNGKLKIVQFSSNYLITVASFISFSIWWLIPLYYFADQPGLHDSLREDSIVWAKSMSSFLGKLSNILTFKQLIGADVGYDFLARYYNDILVGAILFIPLFMILYPLARRRSDNSRLYVTCLFFLLGVIFLNKGFNEPLKEAYPFFLEYIPFFYVFRSPLEKFGILNIFIATLLLSYVMNKSSRSIKLFFIVYIATCSIPYLTLNFNPDFKGASGFYPHGFHVSRKFILKPEYKAFIDLVSSDKEDYRILSLPGSINYQVTMHTEKDRFYRGMDPLLYSTPKPFIATYSGKSFDTIYNNLSHPNIKRLLGLYNVKKILINKDIIPAFGFTEKEDFQQLETIFSNKVDPWVHKNLSLYENEEFLPHLYIPTSVISKRDGERMLDALARGRKNERVVVLDERDYKRMIPDLNRAGISAMALEYEMISPARYRLRIHDAAERFFLVFSETFSKDWKVFMADGKETGDSTDGAHITVNDYANGWLIDAQRLCKNTSSCKQNSSGTYEFDLVLEFSKQRLLHIGALITGIAMIISTLLFAVVSWRRASHRTGT